MNDTFSKLGAQLLQIWKELGVNQRVSVGVATVAVIGGLTGLVMWSSQASYSTLFSRMPEAESGKVMTALDEAKIPYKLGAGGAILVPTDKVYNVRAQLLQKGIPRDGVVGFEIFDKSNFGISDFVQRMNYIRALQGELSRTINRMDDVESASVMVSLPENRLLIERDKHPTASVLVGVRGNHRLPAQTVNAIRFLVSYSVEGLQANRVTIADTLGNTYTDSGDGDATGGLTTSQLAMRQNYEQYLAKKAEDLLQEVLGPGRAIVRVAADFNLDSVTREEVKYDPEGQVVRMETKDVEDSDTTTSNPLEAAGLSANTFTETNAPSQKTAPATSTRTKKTTGNTEYEVSRTTSSTVQAPGAVKRLSVGVSVAALTEGTGTARKVVSRKPEELERYRRLVQSALGVNSERGDVITLEEFEFRNDIATQLTERMDQQNRHQFWWELARTATYPLLGVVVFFLFLRLVKRTPAETPALPLVFAGPGNGHGNGNGHGPGHRFDPLHPGRQEGPGTLTVEALQQLIKENPGGMSHAVRQWLTKGPAAPAPRRDS